MARYLLFESRSPWASGDVAALCALARDLAGQGHEVTLFLVQNAVLAARREAARTALDDVLGRVEVLADEFALRERGVAAAALRDGVRSAGLDAAVDLLAGGARAIWH